MIVIVIVIVIEDTIVGPASHNIALSGVCDCEWPLNNCLKFGLVCPLLLPPPRDPSIHPSPSSYSTTVLHPSLTCYCLSTEQLLMWVGFKEVADKEIAYLRFGCTALQSAATERDEVKRSVLLRSRDITCKVFMRT